MLIKLSVAGAMPYVLFNMCAEEELANQGRARAAQAHKHVQGTNDDQRETNGAAERTPQIVPVAPRRAGDYTHEFVSNIVISPRSAESIN